VAFARAMIALGLEASACEINATFDAMDAAGSGLVSYGQLARLLDEAPPVSTPKSGPPPVSAPKSSPPPVLFHSCLVCLTGVAPTGTPPPSDIAPLPEGEPKGR